jgi:hypothetical protein
MTGKMQYADDRRDRPRFVIAAPLTVIEKMHEIPGFTRDLNNQGVYFYLDLAEGAQMSGDFDFLVELPPEITLSTCCMIRGQGRVVRTDKHTASQLTGIAAEILHYSMHREETAVA